MRSAFFEFNVATSGLFTAKMALNTIGNNIANSETKGYSRQVTLQRATRPLALNTGKGMVGTGSEVYGVKQIRNFYLDTKYWSQNSILGEFTTKRNQNVLLESVFNEPSDFGFSASIDDFFNKLDALSTSADNLSYRTNLVQSAETLAKYFNSTADSLERQQRDLNNEVKITVNQINSIGQQIQNLNRHITDAELGGVTANELRDQRALLVDELSKLVNVEVKETDAKNANRKNFVILINGEEFINNSSINELECRERTFKNNPEDVPGLYDIYWKSTGSKLDTTSGTLKGELKGLLDMRDGNNLNTFKSSVSSVTQNTNGTLQITLKNVNRADMQAAGNITIDGKEYAYTNFNYDPSTNTATIDVPPTEGTLYIGSKQLTYKNLDIDPSSGTVTLNFSPPQDRLGSSIIKIGDMTLDGKITPIYDAENKIVGVTMEGVSNAAGATGPVQPKWISALKNLGSNASAQISSNASYKGIPYYMNKLNEFVRTFAKATNEGLDKNGDSIEGVDGFKNGVNYYGETGFNFFAYMAGDGKPVSAHNLDIDYNQITAANFCVAKEMIADSGNIGAASSTNPDKSDNTIVKQLCTNIRHNRSLFREGEVGDFLSAIITGLGVESDQAYTFEKNYGDIVAVLENQRLSVSGVNVDEEVAAMIKYNQVYNAAAKLINIIDQIYDTTINKMGV